MIRPLTLLTVVAAAGAGLHVYNTKHAVSLLDRELRTIARDIAEAETRTQALQAEWSWTTEQDRLRALAQRHLALEPMQPTQFVRFAEAERRLPPPAAHDASVALFEPAEPAAADRPGARIALLPREAPVGSAPAPVAPPLSAPVLAAVAAAALAAPAEVLPLPAPAAPEPRPAHRNPVAFALPLPPAAARPAEPRPAETRLPEPQRPAAGADPSRPAPQFRAAPPRPTAPARPAPETAPSPAAAPVVPRLPAPAAVAVVPRPPAATQVAAAAVPRAPDAVTALGSFGSPLGGGSSLGSARAALPPPVAFGSPGAAALR